MTSIKKEFGYYPQDLNVDLNQVKIRTLDNLDRSKQQIDQSPLIHRDWFFAPKSGERDFATGRVRVHPFPKRVFPLPKTHEIEILFATESAPEIKLEFYVWCLSFFLGMRLTTTEAGFLDATPLKQGALVDFNIGEPQVSTALNLVEEFWHQSQVCRSYEQICAAVHALFLSQNPNHLEYERFAYLYMALDACFVVARSRPGATPPRTHSERIEWMCKQYNLACPNWARVKRLKRSPKSDIADIRNELIHEALWGQQPLGFSVRSAKVTASLNLELKAFVCRLIAAVLDCKTVTYIQSPMNTRSRYLLDLV